MVESEVAGGAFRAELEERRQRWSDDDQRDKMSNRVTIRLAQLYRETDPDRQAIFNQALADWVRSTDPGTWFDGAALISEFKVCAALPAVREALAFWTERLSQYGDMQRGGEYGLLRSHALSGVHMLEPLVRTLEAHEVVDFK